MCKGFFFSIWITSFPVVFLFNWFVGLIFFFGHASCRILAPWLGRGPVPPTQKYRVLTTGRGFLLNLSVMPLLILNIYTCVSVWSLFLSIWSFICLWAISHYFNYKIWRSLDSPLGKYLLLQNRLDWFWFLFIPCEFGINLLSSAKKLFGVLIRSALHLYTNLGENWHFPKHDTIPP